MPIHPPAIALAAAILAATATSRADDATWTDLFNGQDLDGWIASGDPDAWGVRDGQIVIENPGRGGWLRTARMYRDFELTLEFRLGEGANSGVGLRGSSGGDPAFTGFEIQILDSHGQEPDLRSCGAVYEAIPPDAAAVNPPGRWNAYRIRLIGDTLDVWLNGTKIHDDERLDGRGIYRSPDNPLPLNARAPTGYISLQDHGDPVRFREIRIRDLSPDPEPEGMRPLIDADLAGWFAEDNARWAVEGGTLIGRGGPGHIFTNDRFDDLELRTLVRVSTRGNSGIYFRVRPNPDPTNPWPIGYEAQIDNHDPRNFTGCVYDRAWPEDMDGPITRDNAWFDYRVRAEGERIRTWINGVPMVDTRLQDFERGSIALQGHHDGNVIEFRDLRILELE